MGKAKSLYITRDIDKLVQLLDDTAKSIWPNVVGKGIKEVGQQKRYTFEVDGILSLLDIYQRGDGQTTLRPTGSNTENAINGLKKQYSIYLTCAKGMLKHIRKKDMIDMCL